MKINRRIYIILTVFLTIVLGIIFVSNQEKDNEFKIVEESTVNETTTHEESTIFVYVCGSINNAGVYELPSNSRICNAVDAAGGFNDEASKDYLNLAEVVSDGQKIYVPSEEEAKNLSIKAIIKAFSLISIKAKSLGLIFNLKRAK